MDLNIILGIGIGVIVLTVAGVLVYIGLRNPRSYDEKELQARLDEFNQRGETIDLAETVTGWAGCGASIAPARLVVTVPVIGEAAHV